MDGQQVYCSHWQMHLGDYTLCVFKKTLPSDPPFTDDNSSRLSKFAPANDGDVATCSGVCQLYGVYDAMSGVESPPIRYFSGGIGRYLGGQSPATHRPVIVVSVRDEAQVLGDFQCLGGSDRRG
jgi:hypothetical protein